MPWSSCCLPSSPGTEWRVLCARRWKRPERTMWLKCEATLWIFRAICRKSLPRKPQHLILSDSTSWVCAASRGRSSIWPVARSARELCGHCLASDANVRYRRFPLERNPADEPSQSSREVITIPFAFPCDFKLMIAQTMFFLG